MPTEKFHASVQYDDFEGTSSADRADNNGPRSWLDSKGYLNSDEFLVGISVSVGENHGIHKDPVYVDFLLSALGDYENVREMIDSSTGPILVRKLTIEMKLTEFFSLFKRFDITLSAKGMLEGRDITYTYAD